MLKLEDGLLCWCRICFDSCVNFTVVITQSVYEIFESSNYCTRNLIYDLHLKIFSIPRMLLAAVVLVPFVVFSDFSFFFLNID